MFGYMGQILHVDLNTLTTRTVDTPEQQARDFVGGSGLAARIIFDMVDGKTDPLGPANPLVFMTGPLVGTAMPSAGRCSVCSLSPLTGIWGEANTGGFFGPELRFAGFDGIIVTGQAEKPVWLSIIEGRAGLQSAQELWGCDTYSTQEHVRQAMNEPRARVACIGPAGENKAKMAAIMNDRGRAAGRTGLGAVMGAKNLKAIGVRGSAIVPIAGPQQLADLAREINAGVEQDMASMALRMAGTAVAIDAALMYGDLPIKYYQLEEWEHAGKLSGILMAQQFQNRNTSCFRCPIACARETRAPNYGIDHIDGPEYESIGALGTLALVDDLEGVIYANHLCNVFGLDTISTGSTIALAYEMFSRKILTAEHTGGLKLEYGDIGTTHKLIPLIATRRGFGAILAEGSQCVAERYGVPDLAATVNRLEVPLHDARAFTGMAVSYALSPRGACHMEGDMYGLDMGQSFSPELDICPGDRFENSVEKGRVAARQQAWRNLYNAMTLCQFQNPGVEKVLAALNSVTGWELAANDLIIAGKRIATLKRMLNMRRGLSRASDRLPDILLKPLSGKGTMGTVPDMNKLLAGAYAEYGWNPESGWPETSTLQQLKLSFTLV